jgi:hypothetical protein
VSHEGWNVGNFFATVEQFFSQFLVKFSTSGDNVVQDDLLKPGLEEGVYSCICYYNRPWCDPCNMRINK